MKCCWFEGLWYYLFLLLLLSRCQTTSAFEEPRYMATLKSVRLIWQSLFNIAFRKTLHLDLFLFTTQIYFFLLDLNIYLVSNFRTCYIHYKLEIRFAVPYWGYFVIWSGVTTFVFYTLLWTYPSNYWAIQGIFETE